MEKEIQTQYRQAQKEITSKWNNYMDRAGKRLEGRQNALSSALASGDKDKIAEAKNALESAQKAVTLQSAKYKAMVEDTALRISESNQTAIDYINNRTPNIYANNYNQVNGIAEDAGVQFRIINEDVVKKRIREGDIKLPKSRLSIPKDVRWNTKKMNSAVLQGILQGESMNDIAKRLLPIVDNNVNSALRNARTLVTQAENSGRLDSYKALEEEGAVLKKVWMATGDERTRDAHLELDGQEVGIDEPFVDMDGNELMFPADPSADPATVYNCRCTMVTRIEGVNRDAPSMHEEEIERERSRREEDFATNEAETKTAMDIGKEPERPRKYDFASEEEYRTAREEYKAAKEEWTNSVDEVKQEWLEQDRQYRTQEDFATWAESADVDVEKSFYDHVDPRLYDEIVSVESEMFERFPEVKEYQDAFRKWELRYEDTMDFLMEAKAGLSFGSTFSNAEYIYDSVIREQANGYLAMGDGTLKTTIRHEYGHSADGYCRSKFTTLDSTYQDKVSGKTERRFEARRNYESELISITKKHGSEYSMTNTAEAFAEGFAEYTSNPKSEYGKAFGEFFERWYYAPAVE